MMGAVVLAGGQSRRMGCCKATLMLGEKRFTQHLDALLSGFSPRYLAADDKSLAEGTGFTPVEDIFKQQGPLGGLHAALSAAECEALLTLPCDMPLVSPALLDYILQHDRGQQVLTIESAEGRLFPLCGIYRKGCLPTLTEMLRDGNRKVRILGQRMGGEVVRLPEHFSKVLVNVNTPQNYKEVQP